jgi:formate dehydrogenase major subunit
MSRWVTRLSELQPWLFAEIDPVLAREKGVATGNWVTIRTARSEIEVRALVTERVQPLRTDGRAVHVVGLPYHWGPKGVVTGDIVNDLVGIALDPNVRIHEGKAFTCDLRKGRKRSDQRPREVSVSQASTEQSGDRSDGERRRRDAAGEQASVGEVHHGQGLLHRHDAVHRL